MDQAAELIDYRVDGIITASVSMSNVPEPRGLLSAGSYPGGELQPAGRTTQRGSDGDITSEQCLRGGRAGDRSSSFRGTPVGHTPHRACDEAGRAPPPERDRAEASGIWRWPRRGAGPPCGEMVDGMYARDTGPASPPSPPPGLRAPYDPSQKGANRPDAILSLVGNDHMAFAVHGRICASDLACGCPMTSRSWATTTCPWPHWPAYDLTTIRQPVNRMVEATADAIPRPDRRHGRPAENPHRRPADGAPLGPHSRRMDPMTGLFEPLDRLSRLHPRHHEAHLGRPRHRRPAPLVCPRDPGAHTDGGWPTPPGNAGVIASTMATLHEFPDRELLGEDVIWSGTEGHHLFLAPHPVDRHPCQRRVFRPGHRAAFRRAGDRRLRRARRCHRRRMAGGATTAA